MKKNSLILSTAARYLLPLLLLFSLILLLRGHNSPGGGFVGGLVAASGFALLAIAYHPSTARRILRIQPIQLISVGLLLATISGIIPILGGLPFMTGVWSTLQVPVLEKPGTPVLFDVGVYLLVIGVTLMIIFELAEGEASP
ncbi:MAG: Na+/H+ antiporter subunit B [Anaerolineae bacterium]|nr:Na+/H+ antiporter subunit B [Anaerolineae bacterium]